MMTRNRVMFIFGVLPAVGSVILTALWVWLRGAQ
jgi:hypothetical protein